MTVSRPSGSRVTMWSLLADSVLEALGSEARGLRPAQVLRTSERRTLTVRYSEIASRMNLTSSSCACGLSVTGEPASAGKSLFCQVLAGPEESLQAGTLCPNLV